MVTWKINCMSDGAEPRLGEAATVPAAWAQAGRAVLEELATGEGAKDTYLVTVNGAGALLVAGRTETGELDLAATRAAVEQLVFAVAGEEILQELSSPG